MSSLLVVGYINVPSIATSIEYKTELKEDGSKYSV